MFKDASWHLFPVAAGGTRGVAVPLGQHQELSAVTWALSPLRCAGALSQQWPGHQSGDASAVRCVWLGTPGDTWGARDGQGRAQQGPGPGSWPRERSQFSWQMSCVLSSPALWHPGDSQRGRGQCALQGHASLQLLDFQ